MTTTEERFDRLERELVRQRRRCRWLFGAAALAFAGWLVVALRPAPADAQAAASPKEVRAKAFVGNAFVLRDENGKLRAALTVSEGTPGLALYDANGKARVAIHAARKEPALELYGANGEKRAILSAIKEGGGLVLHDENGKLRAGLIARGPGLALYDENDKLRVMLAVSEGATGLGVFDANGRFIRSVR